jgi:hypothetical protein
MYAIRNCQPLTPSPRPEGTPTARRFSRLRTPGSRITTPKLWRPLILGAFLRSVSQQPAIVRAFFWRFDGAAPDWESAARSLLISLEPEGASLWPLLSVSLPFAPESQSLTL